MPKKRFSAEQIIVKLREVEVLQGQGTSIQDAARQLDITEQTYYRWRKSYGGMRMDQARRLKELEKENARLKKLVGEQALEMAILKEARDFLSKNC
jgi:transposase-like protein